MYALSQVSIVFTILLSRSSLVRPAVATSPCCGPFDAAGNGYGEFIGTDLTSVGQNRLFSIRISYTTDGILTTYPNDDVPCGSTTRVIPSEITAGQIKYRERIEYGICIDQGSVTLTRLEEDGAERWMFDYSGSGVVTTGTLQLTCTDGNTCDGADGSDNENNTDTSSASDSRHYCGSVVGVVLLSFWLIAAVCFRVF